MRLPTIEYATAHDNNAVGETPFWMLSEGMYYLYDDADYNQSTWVFDRGYLCNIDHHKGLRIWFSGRRFHYSIVGDDSGMTLAKDFASDCTVKEIIKEVEWQVRRFK